MNDSPSPPPPGSGARVTHVWFDQGGLFGILSSEPRHQLSLPLGIRRSFWPLVQIEELQSVRTEYGQDERAQFKPFSSWMSSPVSRMNWAFRGGARRTQLTGTDL